jgi:PKHD-type hydroxylase
MIQYLLLPYASETVPWAYWENGFLNSELDKLEDLASGASSQAIVNSGYDDTIRRSSIDWLHLSEDTQWVYDRLGQIVARLNASYFNFDLTGFGEPVQLTKYVSTNNGNYDWHIDNGSAGISRKLSVVLQLTNPNDYEGGELQLKGPNNVISIPRQRGLLTAFPSYTTHRVTPVTRGNRHSLVLWVTGPKFR